MPKPSSVCGSFSGKRSAVARSLYLERGAREASCRCDLNARFGRVDLADEILRALALRAGETVADVGCGGGQHLAAMAAAVAPSGRAFGFDLSRDALRMVHSRGLAGAVAAACHLPLADGSVDALTCNYAIYYLDDVDLALREWSRILKPGARLLVTGPAHGNNRELYHFHERVSGHPLADADIMALGFVEGPALEAIARQGFEEIRTAVLRNPVVFPNVEAFLDYWSTTSLYARTPGASRLDGRLYFERLGHGGEVVVTKRVSIVQARRPERRRSSDGR